MDVRVTQIEQGIERMVHHRLGYLRGTVMTVQEFEPLN